MLGNNDGVKIPLRSGLPVESSYKLIMVHEIWIFKQFILYYFIVLIKAGKGLMIHACLVHTTLGKLTVAVL